MTDAPAVSTETEEREPGSTHTSAHELGDITALSLQSGLQKLEETVGAEGDDVDYYRFTLSEAREVRLGLKLREGEAELSVEDGAGNVLARSVAFGAHEAAVRTLLPGTYYVRVEAVGTVASAYEFKHGVLEADASYRPSNPQGWYAGTAAKLGMPTFEESGYGFELSETSDGRVGGVSLGTVLAVDPTGEALSYRIVDGNGSGLFAIDGASGELSYVGGGEDYESGVTSHELTVRASDGADSTDTTVTVTVTDAVEAPLFGEESYAFALSENADGSASRIALGAVTATDPDGDAVRYRLSGGNESGLFAIDETSGELYYVGAGEDYEGDADPYQLTVRASDGAHTVDTMVTVTVVDNPFDSEKSTGPQGRSEPVGEDIPAGRETSGEVRVDAEPVDGTLRSQSDRDWFGVTLAPGRTYVFALEGDTPRGGTGAAPAIRGLRDANGDPVPGIAGGTEVRYATDAAAAEAVYYIEVGGEGGSGQGRSATRGVGTLDSIDTRSRSDGGTGYRLRANDITETRDAADDYRSYYRSDTSPTGVVTVGGSVTGEIELRGDRDWFAVTLEAGKVYRFELKGSHTDDGTLRSPLLHGIYDDHGNLLEGTLGVWTNPEPTRCGSRNFSGFTMPPAKSSTVRPMMEVFATV